MPADNVEVTATWKLKIYTVTFDSKGGNPIPTAQSVKYKEKATNPTDSGRTV